MKTPITYYGGKQKLVKLILQNIPEHELYTEAFCGGAAVYFAKPKSKLEVVNDLNGHVVTFYRVLKNDFAILRYLIQSTPHSRKVHREAAFVLKHSEHFSDVKVAHALWVQANMSFSSKIFGGYAYEKKSNKTVLRTKNKKGAFVQALMDRLDNTDIECNNALQVIKSRDHEKAFHYVDPPYFNSDCGHYKGYTKEDFVQLLECLANLKGKFLLSSYPSDVLAEFTAKHGWRTMSVEKKVTVSQHTDKVKTEVFTANYDLVMSN